MGIYKIYRGEMVARLKKTRSMRGNISMGHGRVGRHRKHAAGRGLAGGMHHHRILMNKWHPGHFGKCGIRVFHLHKNRKHCLTINTDKLWSLVSEQTRNAANQSKDKAPVINVTKSG